MDKSERIEALPEARPSEAWLYAAWALALVATVGSLFFSEVMQLPPCVLCWYQRIAMYPLVVIIGVGIVTGDRRVKNYALPVCLGGLAMAVYHNLLYYGILPESIAPCTQGISCTSRQIEWLGFITIPLLSLVAFVGIVLCLLFYKPKENEPRMNADLRG
jgi:disulfide bond formation protein DsbB